MPERPTRREIIKLASLTLAIGGLGCEGSARSDGGPDGGLDGGPDGLCPATGQQTAGPYYPREPATRMNIVGDRVGVPLVLELTVLAIKSCEPLENAEVDIWTADSNGRYSGYAVFDTVGEDWLRGQQVTSPEGQVFVQAIMPGAYPDRAVHVHIKVRAPGRAQLTTQLYFPDEIVAAVLAEPGYQGAEQTTNDADDFFAGDTLLTVSGDLASGLTARGTVYL